MFSRFIRPAASSAALFSVHLRVFWLLALCIVATILAWPAKTDAQTAQEANEPQWLEPGKPIERTLLEEQVHRYRIKLMAGQEVNIGVQERGVEITMALIHPNGQKYDDIKTQRGSVVVKSLISVVESTGDYLLEVRASYREAKSGRYLILLDELRSSNERNRELAEVAPLTAEMYKLITKGEMEAAIPPAEKALAVRQKYLGPEHMDTAISLNALGLLHHSRGDHVKAEPLLQQALDIYEKSPGMKKTMFFAVLQESLALIHTHRGDYTKAEPMFNGALKLKETLFGSESPDVAMSLNTFAIFHLTRGDKVQAETLFSKAVAIFEKTRGPEHVETIMALNNLGALYLELGEPEKAKPILQRALNAGEKTLGQRSRSFVVSLSNLAGTWLLERQYEQAKVMLERALEAGKQTLSADHPDIALILRRLSSLHLQQGEVEKAIQAFNSSLETDERNLARNLMIGSERQKLSYLATFAKDHGTAISLHARFAPTNVEAARMGLTALLRAKGRCLEEVGAMIEHLRRRASKEDMEQFERLKTVRTRYAGLAFGLLNARAAKVSADQLRKLEEEMERLENDLSLRSVEFRAQLQKTTLDAVQHALPGDSALVEFVVYTPLNAMFKEEGTPRYLAYVLRAKGEPQWVDLGEAKLIDASVNGLRGALQNTGRVDYRQLSRKLDNVVMQPVRKLLGETSHIFISPDGALNLIPFAALVDENGRYLVNRYSFTHLTSGRDLLRLQVKQQNGSDVTVFADPAFDEASSQDLAAERDIKPSYDPQQPSNLSFDFAKARFNWLPGTADEALALGQMMPGAKVLTRDQATESALKRISRPRILHIATHGFFLQDQEVKTAGGRGESLPDLHGRIENPLLRSGLALAGANLRKSGDEDGILTAMEAAGLDLWGTKLVVLSACDTGVGEVKNGEGVYGLRRAFVLAGSETQVMSLWPVSDRGTKDLMVAYYKRLMRGEGRGEALRLVQLQMLKSKTRSHPYHWASFIQSGEWANLEGRR